MDDPPTPEEAFGAPRIALKETITLVIGPSLIALGLSIGSGEWILAPLAIGTEGWVGIGFVALVSIVLQGLYNIEIGRYVLATGEVPSIGFGRIPYHAVRAQDLADARARELGPRRLHPHDGHARGPPPGQRERLG